MAAALDDAAVAQDEDPVRAGDRRQAVRDDDERAARGEARERVVDRRLGLGIGERGRLVEHEDRPVGQQRASDRHALLLAAGEARVLADDRVLAARQREVAGVDLRRPRRRLDRAVAGVRTREANVVAHAGTQQAGILEDERDVRIQVGRRHVAHVGAAQRDRPRLPSRSAG